MSKIIKEYESDIDIVNALLRVLYGGPREELADRLINRFGSFHAIFRATREDLLKVEGMTETSAAFFTAAVAEFRQALRHSIKDIKPVSEYDFIYLAVALDNESTEKYRIHIYIDASDKIIKYEKVTDFSVKKTVGTACGVNAVKLAIIDYSRREKRLSPDTATLKNLSKLVKPLDAVGIELIDYIDYIGHKFCSTRLMLQNLWPI